MAQMAAETGLSLTDAYQTSFLSVEDAPAKTDRILMEFPWFNLAKRPRLEPITFEDADIKIEVRPSHRGMATIWDKDLLIYAASMINKELERGRPTSRTVRFTTADFLSYTGRQRGGREYRLFEEMLDRLKGTVIKTTIPAGGRVMKESFGWIDNYRMVSEDRGGRKVVLGVEITLNEWSYKALVEDRRILTVNKQYFDLTGGIERRLYEIARKHCGRQPVFRITIERLAVKCGVTLPLRHFKSEIKKISKEDMLPDYRIALEERVNAAATKQVAKQIVMIAMRDVVEGPSISPAGDTTMQKRRETARKRSTETDPYRTFWEQIAVRLKATGKDTTNLYSLIGEARRAGVKVEQLEAMFAEPGLMRETDPVYMVKYKVMDITRRAGEQRLSAGQA